MSSEERNQLSVIFLDIDGVLLPFPPTTRAQSSSKQQEQRLFPDCTLQALDTLLSHTGAKLVLSSTWRVREDFRNDILDCFQSYHREQGSKSLSAVEGFWSWTDVNMHSERQHEIQDWIEKHQPNHLNPIIWLALDDEELVEGEVNAKFKHMFQGHVVKTVSSVGLTKKDVEQGIKLWEAQQQRNR